MHPCSDTRDQGDETKIFEMHPPPAILTGFYSLFSPNYPLRIGYISHLIPPAHQDTCDSSGYSCYLTNQFPRSPITLGTQLR